VNSLKIAACAVSLWVGGGTALAQHTTPPFFADEQPLGGSWYRLTFPSSVLFGTYNYDYFSSGVIYHMDWGFFGFLPEETDQTRVWFYDYVSKSYFHTTRAEYPLVYNWETNKFLRYFLDPNDPSNHYTTNPRRFYEDQNPQAVVEFGVTPDSVRVGALPFTIRLHGQAGDGANSAADVVTGNFN
jgi:hypothetical protein